MWMVCASIDGPYDMGVTKRQESIYIGVVEDAPFCIESMPVQDIVQMISRLKADNRVVDVFHILCEDSDIMKTVARCISENDALMVKLEHA